MRTRQSQHFAPSGKRKFGGQFAVIIATELISAETPIVVSQIDGIPVPVAAYIWTAVGSAARRRFARSICSPITSAAIPRNYPAHLIDLLFSRQAEKKAVWRCASHRNPKMLPLVDSG